MAGLQRRHSHYLAAARAAASEGSTTAAGEALQPGGKVAGGRGAVGKLLAAELVMKCADAANVLRAPHVAQQWAVSEVESSGWAGCM